MTETSLEAVADVAAPRQRGKRRSVTLGYRLDVAGRVLAASVGGFVLASGLAILVSALLSLGLQPRGPAVTSGTLVSWLVWTGAAMWAFYAPTQLRAWAFTLVPGALMWALGTALGIGA